MSSSSSEPPLRGVCPQCEHPHGPRDRFCARCGASLPDPDPEVTIGEGELTLLHTELRGSLDLASALLPHHLAELLEMFQREARAIVEHRRGLVNQRLGASMVAVFGLSGASDDASRAAVESALELRTLARRLEDALRHHRPGLRFTIHSGVECGPLATRPGDGVEGVVSLSGDPVQTADRLRARAGDDETWLGPRIHGVIGDAFETEATEPIPGPDGLPRGRAQRVLRPRSSAKLAPGDGSGRLVGRDWERAMLVEACLEAASETAPRAVAIEGRAGIGKTRLLETFLAEAPIAVGSGTGVRGVTVWTCRAEPPPLGESPYAVLRALLRKAVGPTGSDARATITAFLEGGPVGEADPETVDALDTLLAHPDADAPADLFGRSGRRARRAWTKLVRAVVTPDRPLLVAVDDVHWADRASRAALAGAFRTIRDLPVVMVWTTRPDHDALLTPDGDGRGVARCALESLSGAALGELFWTGREPPTEGSSALRAMVEAAERSTTWAVELGRWLRARAAREGEDDLDATLARQVIPANVEGLVRDRFEALDDEARRLLETAAVFGDRVPLDRLRQMIGAHDRVDAILDHLVAGGWLRPGSEPEQHAFVHRVARQVAYDQIDPALRLELHGRVLELLPDADTEPSVRAHHADEAGRPEDAALAAARAGDAALAYGEPDLGRTWHGRALIRFEALPDASEHRNRWVHTALRWAGSRPTADERHQLAVLRDAQTRALANGLEDEAAEGLWLEGALELARGHGDQALSCFERCLRLVRWDDAPARARIYLALGRAWTMAGEPRRGRAFFEDAIALDEDVAARHGQAVPGPVGVDGRVHLAACLADDGRVPEALHVLDTAEKIAGDAEMDRLLVEARVTRAIVALDHGWPDRCRAVGIALRSHGREAADPGVHLLGDLLVALADAWSEDPAERDAGTALEQAIDALPPGRAPIRAPSWETALLAEAAALARRPRRAVALANQALRGAARRDVLGEPRAQRALALAMRGVGDRLAGSRTAAEGLRASVDVAETRGYPVEAAWSRFRAAEDAGTPDALARATAAIDRLRHAFGESAREAQEAAETVYADGRARSGIQPTVPGRRRAPRPRAAGDGATGAG